jgi:hypothetical protein
MKRQLIFGTMLAAALGVGVGAQSAQSGQAGQPGSSTQERGAKAVTVTGCLQQASNTGSAQSAPSDTTARQQAGSQNAQFILTSATTSRGSTGSGASATGTGTSGASTTPGATTTPGASTTPGATASGSTSGQMTYRLMGGDSANLQQYVNSRVEVTGTLQGGDRGSRTGSTTESTGAAAGTGTGTGAPAGAGATGSGSTAGSARSDRGGPMLHVTSVRQVSGSCTGGEAR